MLRNKRLWNARLRQVPARCTYWVYVKKSHGCFMGSITWSDKKCRTDRRRERMFSCRCVRGLQTPDFLFLQLAVDMIIDWSSPVEPLKVLAPSANSHHGYGSQPVQTGREYHLPSIGKQNNFREIELSLNNESHRPTSFRASGRHGVANRNKSRRSKCRRVVRVKNKQ